jgi:hypothetical protein
VIERLSPCRYPFASSHCYSSPPCSDRIAYLSSRREGHGEIGLIISSAPGARRCGGAALLTGGPGVSAESLPSHRNCRSVCRTCHGELFRARGSSSSEQRARPRNGMSAQYWRVSEAVLPLLCTSKIRASRTSHDSRDFVIVKSECRQNSATARI